MNKKLIPIIVLSMVTAIPAITSASTGEEVWMKYCKKCHGEGGKGDTAMGKKFSIRDYTDPAVQAEWSDEDVKKAILEGVTDDKGKKVMLAFEGKLSDEEVDAVIAYLRSLKAE